MDDVVIGIDASTTAVKAIAFTRDGAELFQARETYPLSNPKPGHFEQDAEHWWAALISALKQVADKVGAARVAAIAIAHQRETFTLIDACRQAAHSGDPVARRARPAAGRPAVGRARPRGDPRLERQAAGPDAGALRHRLAGRTPAAGAGQGGGDGRRPRLLRPPADRTARHQHGECRPARAARCRDTATGTPNSSRPPGCSREQLPELVGPGEICGGLAESIARLTGLQGRHARRRRRRRWPGDGSRHGRLRGRQELPVARLRCRQRLLFRHGHHIGCVSHAGLADRFRLHAGDRAALGHATGRLDRAHHRRVFRGSTGEGLRSMSRPAATACWSCPIGPAS